MTDCEIFKKAVEKAEKTGWDMMDCDYIRTVGPDMYTLEELDDVFCIQCFVSTNHCYTVIFDHSFARSFWGAKSPCGSKVVSCDDIDCGECEYFKDCTIPLWKHCLMEMVLCENPIKYLEKFI